MKRAYATLFGAFFHFDVSRKAFLVSIPPLGDDQYGPKRIGVGHGTRRALRAAAGREIRPARPPGKSAGSTCLLAFAIEVG